MKTWFTSQNGAITLSSFALFSLLARSYYDTRFILVEEYSPLAPGMDTLWIFGFTAILGANIALLLAATRAGRGVWKALFAFNAAIGLGCGAASLLAFTSSTLELVLFTASLITGILAAVSVGFQLRMRNLDLRRSAG